MSNQATDTYVSCNSRTVVCWCRYGYHDYLLDTDGFNTDNFNDKSDTSVKFTKWNMWSKICSWYAELVTPIVKEGQVNSTEQDNCHVEFRVWLFLHDLIKHGPKHPEVLW